MLPALDHLRVFSQPRRIVATRAMAGMLLCGAALNSCPAFAIEPWADEHLSVTNGLALWFDCSRQYAARGAMQLPPLFSGNQTDYLLDSSGYGRVLSQPVAEARPIFRQEFKGAYLSFDGNKNALYSIQVRERCASVTVFVVANIRGNKGGFPCLFSLARVGENDYRTGLNLDLGPASTPRLSCLNLEGSGMVGMVNLLKEPARPFGAWHIFSLESRPGTNGSRLFLDGLEQNSRDRESSEMDLGVFALGARIFSNEGPPPFLRGFHAGDIAELLLYNRVLTVPEHEAVQKYLGQKYRALLERGPELSGGGKLLSNVTNPPAVQIFVPGFTVQAVPLSLPNINNVKYRSDGKLVALGYNGQIYLLSATNGSRVENQVQLFWTNTSLRAPIGLALTPPRYSRGQGVFVAAKGKLSLILDTNADDHADEEIIVADGWKELPHGVDALGVALGQDGSIYFGLGSANYTDPYLIEKSTGEARYNLQSERGTILKVSPDFKHREIVCTGIRFSVGLAFNRAGDLFCTDQEGATWLSNGNPLDELLYIQPGRHYGFPPRHPKYLPEAIDEPSVFDFGPQHQSACGLNFDIPVNGGPVFGPEWWMDNAIVSGFSRGKIWRTELVKTAAGYVARTHQLASLDGLVVDACICPSGDLMVTTHSGGPDWGSGPNGLGHLYKISYADRAMPQPVLAWRSSPSEIRIAFDRTLAPETLRNLARRVEVTQGRYVSAGDRFEVLHPGYAAVISQLSEPRYDVPVQSAALSADRRTLILNTTPSAAAVHYSISCLEWNRSAPATNSPNLPQYPDMELLTDLAGIQADWTPVPGAAGQETPWHGWLPHINLQVAETMTRGSAEHATFWTKLHKPGLLELRGQLDLWEMLQPAIQPGSKLDYERPLEEVTVAFSAAGPFQARFENRTVQSESSAGKRHQAVFHHRSQKGWLSVGLSTETGLTPPEFDAVWFTDTDPRPRAFPLRRLLVPWAEPETSTNLVPAALSGAALTGADWLNGRHIFFNSTVNCQRCHSIRGEGHRVGPDLSNLVHRDYESVLKDILQPSAAINPDFVAYQIEPSEGQDLIALLQTETRDEITAIDASDHQMTLRKDRVKSMKPSSVSLMPEGLIAGLSGAQVKDLMSFLLRSPLEPAALDIPGAPAPRKEQAVKSLCPQPESLSTQQSPGSAPVNIVLCAGPKDHGPSEHDYPLWQKRWSTLLALKGGVHVEQAWEWPSDEQWQKAKALVFYSDNPGWNLERARRLESYLNHGGGVVFVHFAVDGHDQPEALARIIGAAWKSGQSKFRHGPLSLRMESTPVSRGMSELAFVDESYWNLTGDFEGVRVVASSSEDGQPRPQIWMRQHGNGRVFVCIPGHYTWTFDDPVYRLLLLRGISWASSESPEFLSDLSCIGARIAN